MAKSVATPPANLQLPVEVIGADLYGQQFLECARTFSVHRNGVSILLANELAPGAEVIVRNPETSKEAIACVVGQNRESDGSHVYWVAFVEPSANLWSIQFPPTGAARIIQLECRDCHAVCKYSLSDIELNIFEATQQLVRFCKNCGVSRIWKAASLEGREKKPGIAPTPDPRPSMAGSPSQERRGNRRTAMKISACIRFSGVEVVVACEDISKGGFRFTSRKEYPAGTRIEAAVPYTKSSTNIFILAGIIYCQKRPDGQFRHGVTYIKTRGPIGWDP